jgi:hypothetical protein
MTFRLVFGLAWSLVTGLAGGWLALAPWALGEQGSGDWSTVTRNEVAAGAGLIVLAVVGALVVAVQTAASLRGAGVIATSRRGGRTDAGQGSSPEMEQALITLAHALAEDLEAQRPPAVGAAAAADQSSSSSLRDR